MSTSRASARLDSDGRKILRLAWQFVPNSRLYYSIFSARSRVEAERSAALEREAAQARKAAADEALRFADDLAPLGDELDELFSRVRDRYQDLKRRLSAADQRGYGPNAATVQSLLADALRNALWRFTELKIESPHG